MGGMQEMMKAMMGNNVSDEEMAEMQSAYFLPFLNSALLDLILTVSPTSTSTLRRDDGRNDGRWWWWWHA